MTVQDAITDPILRDCLALSHRTKTVALQLLTELELASKSATQPTSPISPTAPSLSSPTTMPALERARHAKRLDALMAQLKSLHRSSIMKARDAKENTAGVRAELDRLNLELQNLYYEQRHLRGEIAACRDFPHKYTQLPLLPLPDFLAANPTATDLDPHALMIARIKDEKLLRENLELERKRLLAKKHALMAENKKRREELAKSERSIEKISNDVKGMIV